MKRQYTVAFRVSFDTFCWLDTDRGWRVSRGSIFARKFGSIGEAKRAARKMLASSGVLAVYSVDNQDRLRPVPETVEVVRICMNTCRPGLTLFREFDAQLRSTTDDTMSVRTVYDSNHDWRSYSSRHRD